MGSMKSQHDPNLDNGEQPSTGPERDQTEDSRLLLRDLYSRTPVADQSAKVIRVFKLAPWCCGRDVHGRLERVDLADRPKYETLSYTWAHSGSGKVIRLNGSCELEITDHLYSALCRLRKRWKSRTIWIDAICINQENHAEKSRQVSIMGDIYRQGQSVNVWLGDCTNVTTLHHYLTHLPWHFMETHGPPKFRWWTLRLSMRIRVGLEAALRSPVSQWHTRTWPVQEFILSRRVYLCFGPVRVQRPSVSDGRSRSFFHQWEPSRGLWPTSYPDSDNLSRFWAHIVGLEQCDELTSAGRANIYLLCESFSDLEATDPRDLVFSLIGLLNAEEADLLQPDYSASCAEIFAKATYASICAGKPEDYDGLEVPDNWKILAQVSLPDVKPPAGIEGLPSWAVDFSNHRPLPYWSTPGSCAFLQRFQSDFHVDFMKTDHGTLQLVTRGTVFDRVSDTLRLSTSDLKHIDDGLQDEKLIGLLTLLFISMRNAARKAIVAGGFVSKTSEAESTDDNIWCELVPLALRARISMKDSYVPFFRERALVLALDSWQYLVGLKHAVLYNPRCRAKHDLRMTGIVNNDDDFTRLLIHVTHNKHRGMGVFTTRNGFVGVAPPMLSPGDAIAIIPNSTRLMVLHPRGKDWIFRGFAWVQGLMQGEALESLKYQPFQEQNFSLI